MVVVEKDNDDNSRMIFKRRLFCLVQKRVYTEFLKIKMISEIYLLSEFTEILCTIMHTSEPPESAVEMR